MCIYSVVQPPVSFVLRIKIIIFHFIIIDLNCQKTPHYKLIVQINITIYNIIPRTYYTSWDKNYKNQLFTFLLSGVTYKARYWVGHTDYMKYIQLIFEWALDLYTTKTKKERIYYLYMNIHEYNFQVILKSFLKVINMKFTNTFSWISQYLLGR